MKLIYPVILVIICLSFNILISRRYSDKPLSPDENGYNRIALAVLKGDNYHLSGDEKVDIGLMVTPFYSFLIAATYFIGGVDLNNPYILNIVLNCITVILLYYVIKTITHRPGVSFIFVAGLVFYYPLWRMNFSIMMEVTTVFFLSLTLYLLLKYFNKVKYSYLYFSSLTFSILTLINNRFIVLLFAFFVFILACIVLKKQSFIKSFLIPAIISLLILSPWFIRQYIVYDQFVFFTPVWHNVVADKTGLLKHLGIIHFEENPTEKPYSYKHYIDELRTYNTPEVQENRAHAFTIEKYNELINKHDKNENLYFARIKKYFTLYYKDFQFMAPNDYRLNPPATKPYRIIQILFLLPVFLLSFAGFIISIKRRNKYVMFLSALFFSHLFLHVLIHYIDRYRVTILPVLLIIAAYGITEVYKILMTSQFLKSIRQKFNNAIWKKEQTVA